MSENEINDRHLTINTNKVGVGKLQGGNRLPKDGSPKECRDMIMQGKNGFLVPVRDAHHLAAAMERFILEPGLAERMGMESLRIAREKYDVHKVNKVILDAMGIG